MNMAGFPPTAPQLKKILLSGFPNATWASPTAQLDFDREIAAGHTQLLHCGLLGDTPFFLREIARLVCFATLKYIVPNPSLTDAQDCAFAGVNVLLASVRLRPKKSPVANYQRDKFRLLAQPKDHLAVASVASLLAQQWESY